MNNSVFRKIMENIRNHKYIKLVSCQEKYGNYVARPNFIDGYPYLEEWASIFRRVISKTIYWDKMVFENKKGMDYTVKSIR